MELREIGKLLQEERLRQGVELPAVAKVTRISVSSLQAIEEGDERALPNAVYIKGFVRHYAQFLKLDPAVADEALTTLQFSSSDAMWTPAQDKPAPPGHFSGWKAGLAAAMVVVLVGGAAMMFLSRETPEHEPDNASLSAPPESTEPAQTENPAPQPAGQPPATAPLLEQLPEETPVMPPPPLAAEPATTTELPQDELSDADRDAFPTVREDLHLQKAALDGMRLTIRPDDLRADFEVRNLTDDLISGQISIFFITDDSKTLPALGNEEIPQFRIRNFRPVSTRLHLPSGLNQEDLAAVQFVITDSQGEDVFVRTYPVEQD